MGEKEKKIGVGEKKIGEQRGSLGRVKVGRA